MSEKLVEENALVPSVQSVILDTVVDPSSKDVTQPGEGATTKDIR